MRFLKLGAKVLGGLLGMLVLGLCGWAGYASATADARLSFPDTPMPAVVASTDPAVIEQGRYLFYGPAHCAQCHAAPDHEHYAEGLTRAPMGGMDFDMGPMGKTWAANLTPDPETGIGKRTDGEIARTIRSGILHDGSLSLFMYASAAKPADEDLVAIVSFLRSLPPSRNEVPKGQWGLMAKMMLPMMSLAPKPAEGPGYVAASEEPSVERGRYLAENVTLCVACHSQFDMATFQPTGPKAAGGMVEGSHGADTDMEYAPPNLTSDATGVTGRLDEDAFVKRLKGGRAYATSIMPWENFSQLTDSDARSIYRYLRSLPAVKNDTGPSYREVGSFVADAG